jgi:hypothetical protein
MLLIGHPLGCLARPHRVKVNKILLNRTICFGYLVYSADRAPM